MWQLVARGNIQQISYILQIDGAAFALQVHAVLSGECDYSTNVHVRLEMKRICSYFPPSLFPPLSPSSLLPSIPPTHLHPLLPLISSTSLPLYSAGILLQGRSEVSRKPVSMFTTSQVPSSPLRGKGPGMRPPTYINVQTSTDVNCTLDIVSLKSKS